VFLSARHQPFSRIKVISGELKATRCLPALLSVRVCLPIPFEPGTSRGRPNMGLGAVHHDEQNKAGKAPGP
jgi:hypothetical protein